MGDLISRCELFNKLAPVQTLGEAYAVIQGMQTAPEVIRCKDCEYYELTEWVAHRCDLVGRSVYGNDYCCWAERKREQP